MPFSTIVRLVVVSCVVATSGCAIFRDTTGVEERGDTGSDVGLNDMGIGEDDAAGDNDFGGLLTDMQPVGDVGLPDMPAPPDGDGGVTSDTGANDAGFELPGCPDAPLAGMPEMTVGNGTTGSCTEGALKQAIAAAQVIEFDCGGPATIPMSGPIQITRDTTLIGAGDISLDGQGATNIFVIDAPDMNDSSPHLRLFGMTLESGYRFVTDNTDDCGAAVYRYGGTLTAVDSLFAKNSCDRSGNAIPFGGAIVGLGGGGVFLYDSIVEGNAAYGAGGVYTYNSEVGIHRTVVRNNEANGISAGGLGLFEQGPIEICGSEVTGNSAIRWGGGFFYDDDEAPGSSVTISQTVFANNSSGEDGGGADIEDTILTVEYSSFHNNTSRSGGALWMSNVQLALENTSFTENSTTEGGGAIHMDGARGEIRSASFVANNAGAGFEGGAIAHYNPGGPFRLENTAFARNTGATLCVGTLDGTPNMQGPAQGAVCSSGTIEQAVDLGLVEPVGGQFVAFPQSASPLIGAGQRCSQLDQLGASRPADCTIGAVEPR